jgi:hypothetical protein
MCMPIEIILLAIPLIIVHFSLAGYSLHNITRSTTRTRKIKCGWVVIILIFNLIGPLLYILFGREKINRGR